MKFTLRDLLSAKIFLNLELVAGKAGLDRNVTSLIVIDGPGGYKYTEPNMLVITSGYFLSLEDTAAQLELIEKLTACGVTGMMIKPFYFKDSQIPQPLIDQAEILNFPLIVLHTDSPSFREIIKLFETSLFCRGSNSFIQKEDIPNVFNYCINSESIPGLAKQLHTLSGLCVTTLFEQNIFSYPTENVNDVFSQKIADFSSQKHIIQSQSFPGLLEFRYKDGESGRTIFGLGIEFGYKPNSSGSIWMDCSGHAPDENDVFLLKSAQLACKTEIKHIFDYQQKQARNRAQFVERLLSGKLRSWQETVILSKGLNWRIPLETQLLVISCANKSDHYLDVEAEVSSFFKSKNETIIVQPYQEYILTFLPPKYTNQIGICVELQAALQKRFPNDHFVLGLGRVVTLQNASLSFQQAIFAAQVGELINPSQTVHEFQKLGCYRLTCTTAHPDELFRFYNDYIGPLLELDKSTNLDLLNTLRVYFECQENFSRTGKALFLQPNAVRYRMELIEKACNIDFKNHFDSLNMKLALYLMPIVSSKTTPKARRTIPDFPM